MNCGDVLKILYAKGAQSYIQQSPNSPTTSAITSNTLISPNLMQQFIGAARKSHLEEVKQMLSHISDINGSDPVSKVSSTCSIFFNFPVIRGFFCQNLLRFVCRMVTLL
jgi:hypothetical protein